MAYLVPALRELTQLETPDSLFIIDAMDGIVNTVANDDEKEVEEWSKVRPILNNNQPVSIHKPFGILKINT